MSSSQPAGRVITFYSFKGGTGRSMALANVAWILAANGKRVLMADWDLESPGLHRFFKPFLDPDVVRSLPGIIDLVRAYEDEANKEREGRPADWRDQYVRIQDYARSINWTFPGRGRLDFLSAGRQNVDYGEALSGMEWKRFYERLDGYLFLRALRAAMKRQYDYVLIDSRTGLNDVASICTCELPDTLVTCFTLSDQGIIGAAQVARDVHQQQGANAVTNVRDDHRLPVQPIQPIQVLPVPMRVDDAEKEKRDAGRTFARRAFGDLPLATKTLDPNAYWEAVEVPYQAFYSYEETLATFGDAPGAPSTLLTAYETLTRYITEDEVRTLPRIPEETRAEICEQYRRTVPPIGAPIEVEYASADQAWAEWIEAVLSESGMKVVEPRPLECAPDAVETRDHQIITLVSGNLPDHVLHVDGAPPSLLRLGVQVSPSRLDKSALSASVNLSGLESKQGPEAADRLLKLVGRGDSPLATRAREAGAFPGRKPELFPDVIQRNKEFTGRGQVMWQVRQHFRSGRSVVALTGMGGVGKTELAIEYAFRFSSAYDLVWWINAENDGSVAGAFTDLAERIGVPVQSQRTRTVAATLDSLRRGRPSSNWLLVLDNARDPSQLAAILAKQVPGAPGHILVTTQAVDWGRYATGLGVDVFLRPESTEWLQRKVPSLGRDDAHALADALGDLPIALDAAIGLLGEGEVEVQQYLSRLRTAARGEAAGSGRPSEPAKVRAVVAATFDEALKRLREQSPGAHRLLQLLSVMAPEISLDFIQGDAMAAALLPYDPALQDRHMIQPLLQRLERFSLLTVDGRSRHVRVHRLLQEFVLGQMSEADLDVTRHEVHRVLVQGRPGDEVDTPRHWHEYRRLWPHLATSDALHCKDPDVRQLLIDRVRYLWLRGDWPQGEALAREISGLWEGEMPAAAGPVERTRDSGGLLLQQLLRLRFNLANILRDQARYAEALELDRRTLDEQSEVLGEDGWQTLLTAAGYAADLRALGRYQEALRRERATSELWESHFGPDYPYALAASNNLAVSLRAVGQYKEAFDIDERVHERRLAILGPDNHLTWHSANCLGRDLRELGDYRESVAWLRGVLDSLKNLSEPNLKGVLAAQTNLATSLRSDGQVKEAGDMLDDAYRQLEANFGEDRPDTLACRLNRAVNHLRLHGPDSALTEMRETVKTYERTFGPTHLTTLVSQSNLSAAVREAGLREESLQLAESVFHASREVVGASHPFTLAAQINFAVCLDDEGRVVEAANLVSGVADALAEVFEPSHPDAVTARLTELALRVPVGERDRVLRASVDLAALSTRLGPDHPTVRDLRVGRLVYRLIDASDPF